MKNMKINPLTRKYLTRKKEHPFKRVKFSYYKLHKNNFFSNGGDKISNFFKV